MDKKKIKVIGAIILLLVVIIGVIFLLLQKEDKETGDNQFEKEPIVENIEEVPMHGPNIIEKAPDESPNAG